MMGKSGFQCVLCGKMSTVRCGRYIKHGGWYCTDCQDKLKVIDVEIKKPFDEPTCPYCNEKYYADNHSSLYEIDNMEKIICENCNNDFYCFTQVCYEFICSKNGVSDA